MLPLYRFNGQVIPYPPNSDSPHPGLVFDKYINGWGSDWHIPEGAKKDFYQKAARYRASNELRLGLDAALDRQGKLAAALGGIEPIVAATDWRFVSGLGSAHPFEAGFTWHRTLGVPYLPGSSVKGLIRAWADPRTDSKGVPQGWGKPAEWADITHLFGDTDEDGAGTLIVFDALPVGVPELEVDIMNPHYSDYYNKKLDSKRQLIPPADYLSPTPIFFLAVASGQMFRFILTPRPGAHMGDKSRQQTDLKCGKELLQEALKTLGVGGKTAVGYGRFVPPAAKGSSNNARASSAAAIGTSQGKAAPPAAAPAKDELTLFREWFDRENFAQGQKKGQQEEIRKRVEALTDPRQGTEYVRAKLKEKAAAPSVWAWLQQQHSNGDKQS